MSEKLRECPFCGGNKLEISNIEGSEETWISCFCGIDSSIFPTKDKAVNNWNTRHDPQHETVEELNKFIEFMYAKYNNDLVDCLTEFRAKQ